MIITVSLSFTSLVVRFDDLTHLRILLSRLNGYQGWKETYGSCKYVIEYSLNDQSQPILCEYDDFDKWKQILKGLDEVFDK